VKSSVKIIFEEEVFEGAPSEIIDDLREKNFRRDEFPSTESFLRCMRDSFVRLTDMPCPLPEGSLDVRARALLERLAEVDALEILEDG
jgi:hypothetical protein